MSIPLSERKLGVPAHLLVQALRLHPGAERGETVSVSRIAFCDGPNHKRVTLVLSQMPIILTSDETPLTLLSKAVLRGERESLQESHRLQYGCLEPLSFVVSLPQSQYVVEERGTGLFVAKTDLKKKKFNLIVCIVKSR